MSGHSMRGHSMSGHSMSGHSMSGHSNQLKSSNLSNRYVKNGKEKVKEKERKKEKEREKPKLNSLKYSFIMFEISIENRFEINENYLKMIEKVTKMGAWGGSGTDWGPESFQDPKGLKSHPHFGAHFGVSWGFKI